MIRALTLRHITVFFRDRGAVFFSLLSPLTLFMLYFFFLGNTQLSSLKESLPTVDEHVLGRFLNTWVYAGIVMTTAVTTGLAALGVFVDDRQSGRFTDFAVSPIPRWKVIVSYLSATVIIAIVITTLVYILAQVHLVSQGAPIPSLEIITQSVVSYSLIAFSFGALSSLMVTFIKTNAAFTSLSIIVGTGIGFIAGIYVPLGVLTASIANVLYALPFAQAAVLMREPLMSSVFSQLLQGQPAEVGEKLRDTYGLEVVINGNHLATSVIMLVLAGLGALALLLAVVRISRKLR